MWGIFMLSVVSVCIPFVNCFRGFLVGPGRWLALNINRCDNPEQYEIQIDIKRKKINRTHDCFDFSFDTVREFNVTYAVEIELYQEVDGGFKYHQTMKYDSLCTIFKKTSEENMKRVLTIAKVDPPDCPIPRGSIRGKNFVMDYRKLPKIGMYGTFESRVHIMYEEKRVGCVRTILTFEIRDDEENVEDNGGGATSKGIIRIDDFVMDYRQLPKHGVYGTFLAVVRFTYKKATVACLKCVLNFDEKNGQNSDEEDDGLPELPFARV